MRTKDLKFYRRIFMAVLVVALMAGFSQAVYAAEYYEEEDEVPTEFVAIYNLNLRAGPSTDYDRLTLIPAGSVIIVTYYVADIYGEAHTFSAVTFGDRTGFVATRYIMPRANLPELPTMPLTSFEPGEPPAAVANGNIEKISWWTMRHNILTTGTTIQIYDIRTGLTYYVRAFSLGNHADVETLTVQDTEIMRQTSGGFSWDARPVLATFNGRTFAAAIHTMPHAGSTIHTNGKNGHVCLHFFESTPHNGNQTWRAEMQAAVMQAFNHN